MQRLPDVIDLLASTDPVAAFIEAHASDHVIGLRTSGTTSAPRMVVRSTSSWVDSFPSVSALSGIDSSSRVWIPGPVSSTMNLFARVHAAFAGAAASDDASSCTHAQLTPAMLERCLDDDVLPSGCTVIVAGDVLRPALRDRAERAGITVHHYYGSSEQSFIAWGTASDDLRAFPGVELAVRDGEIWTRSPFASKGYSEAGDPGMMRLDDEGWISVGDRGALDGDVLRVAGRGSLAVTTAGATILVADVEAVLRPHAAGQVIVTGLPHERLGAVVVAVVTDPSEVITLAEIAREHLPPAQRPRRWFALESIPITVAGKVDRDVVTALLSGAEAISASGNADTE